MKATKVLNIVFGCIAIVSCLFSLGIIFFNVVPAIGEENGLLAAVIALISLFHFIALAVLAVPFVIECVLAKKYRVNVLFFIITFALAVALNSAVLLSAYLL